MSVPLSVIQETFRLFLLAVTAAAGRKSVWDVHGVKQCGVELSAAGAGGGGGGCEDARLCLIGG